MSETATFRGSVRPVSVVHGALNCIVMLYDSPNDWVFKQFISQEQLERFASDNMLEIKEPESVDVPRP